MFVDFYLCLIESLDLGSAPFFSSLTILNFPILFLLIPGSQSLYVLLFYPPSLHRIAVPWC